ncbi:hypothetical protein PPYR_01246 [Photinus pyralis]|uniref:Uncharacterized protein n=1 Tax=Photinus pyralis TaxID=7054 RepID=A0A1Y1N9J8_PHOPY|nr:uncharacterized protein LOC116174526 isoform X1 [Photinus pyralis]XP_031348328.1 uncharacterized protein LOC116174526 isoform X1 [Photinus pyralis]KAB0804276.1 hypothetical protein PPYR_01246 [Photinus pyralis]
MSSPSPVSQIPTEHTYQPSDSSDHVLISHNNCQCTEVLNKDSPKCDPNVCHSFPQNKCKSNHHHNLINLSTHGPANTTHSHSTNQSVHVHVHSPPGSTLSKQPPQTACNCHSPLENESNADVHQTIQSNRKIEADDRIEVSPLPPALPPRPPPRPRTDVHGTLNSRSRIRPPSTTGGGIRKYVFWCCACGGLATILGALFLAVYFLLRSYTSTLGYFETIPTFVPATMLILTGLCVICLARRKNRYSYLIKVCGICCLVCALTCVLVTITTTVIHMNRLQTLRECVYTQKTRTCTCYSVLLEAHASTDEGMRFVFDATPDCEVIHGALYSCLRAMFGLSVSGILVCIFSCMLVYQLLSHEKKKMYWEQLELRCRSLYQHGGAPASTHSSVRGTPFPSTTYCSCCEECRYPPLSTGSHMFSWDNHALERFWTPGRVGNFYSPNPGEEGNSTIEGHPRERNNGGWSWRRLPWNRGNNTQHNVTESNREPSLTYEGGISSSDSQYGFGHQQANESRQTATDPVSGSSGSYSVLDSRPPAGGVYVWGPPPPYSNPNSPARRPFQSPSRFHHMHHHQHAHNPHCQINNESQSQPFTNDMHLRRSRLQHSNKANYENTLETEVHRSNDNSESTDTSSCVDHVPHTLTARKVKKKVDIASLKSVACTNRTNVQNVFNQTCQSYSADNDNIHEDDVSEGNQQILNDNSQCRFLPRLQGVENAAFQNQESPTAKPEATESEVYFADVSSCCNISLKNDGQDSSVYDEAMEIQKPRLMPLQNIQGSSNDKDNSQILQTFQENISSSTVTEDEEYLAHRLGKRQLSTRSRLPFPLPNNHDGCDMNSDPCIQLLPKDISQNSLCSSVQTPMTETTDDAVSPGSPTGQSPMNYYDDGTNHHISQRHGTFSNQNLDQFLAPDAQYEVIQEQSGSIPFRQNYNSTCTTATTTFSNLTNTISSVNNFGQNYLNNQTKNFNSIQTTKNIPPKSLNFNQLSNTKKNLGSNISNLIQNLGVNPVGLLYSEANSSVDEEVQCQGCHSDGTMDSGWHSGSEKQERGAESGDSCTHRAVNV